MPPGPIREMEIGGTACPGRATITNCPGRLARSPGSCVSSASVTVSAVSWRMALTSTDKVVASYRDILNWVVIGGLTSMLLALVLSYLFAKRILRLSLTEAGRELTMEAMAIQTGMIEKIMSQTPADRCLQVAEAMEDIIRLLQTMETDEDAED